MATKEELRQLAQNVNLPDNSQNLIDAEDLRNQLDQERLSSFNLDEDDLYSMSFVSNRYNSINAGDALEEIDIRVDGVDQDLKDLISPNTTFREKVVNIGYLDEVDIDGGSVGDSILVGGDISSAILSSKGDNRSVIEVSFSNSMGGSNYYIRIHIESRSTNLSSDINNLINDYEIRYPPIFRVVSSTKVFIVLREADTDTQKLRVHLEAVKY